MSATGLRALLHLCGLVVAALLFLLLPFSPWANAVIAPAFWIMDGLFAEMLFNARAGQGEKIRDLRDRTDNPPS